MTVTVTINKKLFHMPDSFSLEKCACVSRFLPYLCMCASACVCVGEYVCEPAHVFIRVCVCVCVCVYV
jgi:hypothetical protein